MNNYYVNTNAQVNGDHEVHRDGCTYFPANHIHLGAFAECYSAVAQARQYFRQANGCYYCCRACHTG